LKIFNKLTKCFYEKVKVKKYINVYEYTFSHLILILNDKWLDTIK